MCWQITCHFLQQTITSPVHVSLCFPWFNLSPPTHSLILLFPDSLAGLSHFLASVRALAITLVRPFCVPHFGFCSPCSFSFTFPHPPALFNSVIMTYSLGTWPSPSPTLHSRPSFRLPSIPPLSQCGRTEALPRPDASTNSYCEPCFMPVCGSRGRAEDGGHREGPQTSPQLLLGCVSWV